MVDLTVREGVNPDGVNALLGFLPPEMMQAFGITNDDELLKLFPFLKNGLAGGSSSGKDKDKKPSGSQVIEAYLSQYNSGRDVNEVRQSAGQYRAEMQPQSGESGIYTAAQSNMEALQAAPSEDRQSLLEQQAQNPIPIPEATPIPPTTQPQAQSSGFMPSSAPPEAPPQELDQPQSNQAFLQSLPPEEIASMTPAKAAAMGLIPRTPEEQNMIAKMISGELAGNTLKNLSSPDENARAIARTELANVIATVENRASSSQYQGILGPRGALQPSQYNSLMSENMGTTDSLYSKYGSFVQNAVSDYYTGKLTPTDYELTSYYNPDIVEPDWGGMMSKSVKVGHHKFGVLPEYRPSNEFKQNFGPQESVGFMPSLGESNGV